MYKLFIGRWSPFHKGHKYIIDSYVNNGHKVCIAIRDTKLSKQDPFSFELRKKLIDDYYKGNKSVEVIKIPDIDQVCVGRGVGYGISEVPEEIKNISGTKEREKEKPLFNDGKGACLWFTGLPCSGKTTLIKYYSSHINNKFKMDEWIDLHILDGDAFRKEVTPHLGFSKLDRIRNLQTAFDIIKPLVNNGVVVLAGFVSPIRKTREAMKKELGNKFKEIYVKASADTCSKRDVKGMWKLAKEGKIKDFTGYSAEYEEPENPDLVIDTDKLNVIDSIKLIEKLIKEI
jgi:adenylylsulfate kinase